MLLMLYIYLVFLFLTPFASADEVTHVYLPGEEIVVYANKIGPFNNPLETYAYFEMPGCPPASWEHKLPSIGQMLAGDEFYKMNMEIRFNVTSKPSFICTMSPTEADLAKWERMVQENYWYQLTADGLPMWATLGKTEGGVARINTHQHFSFGINGNNVIQVTLVVGSPVALKGLNAVNFTYSANFTEIDTTFDNRFDLYLDDTFFEHHVHWFSIFNSLMAVFLLIAIVLGILHRTLKADYARFNEDHQAREMGKEEWVEESGWKQLQHDVFRVPPNPVLLCALLGTGCQLGILFLVVTLLSLVSMVYTTSGTFASYTVFSYLATSFAAGFFSATHFSRYALIGPTISKQWIRCMMITATLFPGTIALSAFVLNFVAISYGSAQAIAFGGMLVLLLLWLCVSVPLVVLGTVFGRHSRLASGYNSGDSVGVSRMDIPRVNQIPRLIPPRRWYNDRRFIILACGVLPFSSIFIELYYIFTSFWNYKVYYVFGFLLLVLIIFFAVTACVAITAVYFLLNSEDHRWPWTAFLGGASTSLYVLLYSILYYNYKTRMSGFFMFSYYFSYTFMMCFVIAILCGTVAFIASSKFVSAIYRNIKFD